MVIRVNNLQGKYDSWDLDMKNVVCHFVCQCLN